MTQPFTDAEIGEFLARSAELSRYDPDPESIECRARLAATLAELAGLRTRLRDLTTAFEEEAYHRMSAECEVARLKGGGDVTIVMHEDRASRSLPGALKEEKDNG